MTQAVRSGAGKALAAPAETVRECLNETVRVRRGKDSSAGVPNMVSEQDMYAALAMHGLSKLTPALGAKLRTELPNILNQMGTSKGEHLMMKAADRIMRAMVRAGEISHEEYRSVRDTAFGKAQFNGDRTELSDHDSAAPASGSNALGFDAALLKAESNNAATAPEIEAFKARGAEISRQKYLEKKANGTLGKNKAAKAAGLKPQGERAESAVSGIEVPQGFLWKPQSDSDGKLAILLGSDMLSAATGVRILSSDGKNVLAEGKFVGLFGATGRRIYRFSKDGDSFPHGCKVAIQLATGETKLITVQNPGQRLERK